MTNNRMGLGLLAAIAAAAALFWQAPEDGLVAAAALLSLALVAGAAWLGLRVLAARRWRAALDAYADRAIAHESRRLPQRLASGGASATASRVA